VLQVSCQETLALLAVKAPLPRRERIAHEGPGTAALSTVLGWAWSIQTSSYHAQVRVARFR